MLFSFRVKCAKKLHTLYFFWYFCASFMSVRIHLCFFIASNYYYLVFLELVSQKTPLFVTVVIKYERHKMSIGTSFVKIWNACSCEFKPNFLIFWCLYHLRFDLETIGELIKSSSGGFEKKPNQFWHEIWIQVLVILLQLYTCNSWQCAILNFQTGP